ncbi:hypothetical protein KO525_02200 [Psychrosphaera sp. B3R10]|uniref:Succinate dehydrogenase iron-sulfur subunit n=1 Tax=Psychrosphaera algicola TaxID=3023714 RepID=A0ABT5FAY0_9GAMM|nr:MULTISPECIES: 2Fe-2S iron-sulfur cluster-binding protein [unclassified Psychrosphaera]MBU2884054.1 hypothetical protein [Psychrosphaera sp. I2R16]MBU2988184.1 hypothetical protein [Psychrosphaera sp. B3R10]MDC2888289.1 2Fe-2S iron-sulfur cluster-binding protein [Psychrosphaera sp. G1-22]MDO6718393.1 2Fe-2S iron-sulfur cluster-binding protein [Psychrosphaera sp. 1_MG-2023]
MAKVKLNLFRLDLFKAADGYFETVTVSYSPNETLLEVLQRFRDQQDPSFGYDKNCRLGLCLSCRMKINGRPGLACQTNVHALVEKSGQLIQLEPIKLEHAVKDLIVDADLASSLKENKR